MDFFTYKANQMYCEEVPLQSIADSYGTPVYVYSKNMIDDGCQKLQDAFNSYNTLACFAVKANSNLSILKQVFTNNLGADIVSIGELQRVLLAGVDPKKIVYSGVGKRDDEIGYALDIGILSFNVESEFELERLNQIAGSKQLKAPVCLRINPDIDAKTNPKIATGLISTKFGLAQAKAAELLHRIHECMNIRLVGIACHIGSQMTDLGPIKLAAESMSRMATELLAAGFSLEMINMGGGLGIRYRDETPPSFAAYANTLIAAVKGTSLKLIIEPGRMIASNSGILLAKVIGVKKSIKRFVIVDAAMTELMRPTLYGAYHKIEPVGVNRAPCELSSDIVGPVCETGDILGVDRILPELEENDLLVIRSCGSYAAAMSSNYNSRPRPPEVMVDGSKVSCIRKRESVESLWALELPT